MLNPKNDSEKLEQKWEEEYYRRFSGNIHLVQNAPEIKLFIKSLLQSQQDRIVKAVKKIQDDLPSDIWNSFENGVNRTCNDILQIIKQEI